MHTMGAKLSLLAPSAPTIALSSYVDILDGVQYDELINNSRFLKTVKAVGVNNTPLVTKVLIKPNNVTTYNLNLQQYTELVAKEASLLAQFNCFLPNHKFIETDRAGYLIRRYVKYNLYDRLSIRPFLEPIEKKFIIFQLLKLTEILHDHLDIRHGDIKLENIMVSSTNWIMLTDFASFSKPVYIPEDNPHQFSFYFDTSDRRVCNIAPERFYNSSNTKQQNFNEDGTYIGKNQVTTAMDLFSLGCIIAQLMKDGEPLFTLSSFFRYVKQDYIPDISSIEDSDIRKLIELLILISPDDRPSASSLLADFKGTLFPHSFYEFLYDFMKLLNDGSQFKVRVGDDSLSTNDLRVDYIYKNFHRIAECLNFDYSKSLLTANYGMNLNLSGMPKDYKIKESSNFTSEDSPLIILDYIFSISEGLKQPSSKIKVCELITALSERITDENKLDRSLPYLCKFIDEYILATNTQASVHSSLAPDTDPVASPGENTLTARVVVVALDSIVTLLNSCSYITPLNVSLFDVYLLPKLTKLIQSDDVIKDNELVKIKLASCIPYLAQFADRFSMMAKNFKLLGHEHTKALDIESSKTDYLSSKRSVYDEFQEVVSLLLTDSNPRVRSSLVDNIEPLCRFFGVDKTNDFILPHLITYLNDPDVELKLYFLKSILVLGPYIGVLSFEQYLLPLLIQSLGDSDQLVVLSVLKVFVSFVSDKLINPHSEFNALNIYKELLDDTVFLLLHPNEWIRQSVLNLILAIGENLLNADKFCFLYPQIKNYLMYDVTNLDWDTLYPCLTLPVSKIIYQLMLDWFSTNSEKSLFWKKKTSIALSPSNFAAFSKDLGKSVFVLPKFRGSSSRFTQGTVTPASNPLSHEDKQWLLKFKSVGLEDRDIWKIFVLRDYIQQVGRSLSTRLHSLDSKKELPVIIPPRNVFFDITYKSELVTSSSKGSETNIQKDGVIAETLKNERSDSSTLILPNFSKVSASIQTVEENVFGELEINHAPRHHQHIRTNSGVASNHKVISSNSDRVIIANSKHSYTGHDPYILHYLGNVTFDLTIDSFSEFGDPVKVLETTEPDWIPKGQGYNQIDANTNPGDPDNLTCLAVSPTSEFFVTGSESGVLKLWDSTKIEKNIMFKNPSLSASFKSLILHISFMPNRNVFSVATKDGRIRIFRVDISRGKNRKIVKYSRLVLVRKFVLEEKEYTTLTSFVSDMQAIVVTTSKSRIIAFNLITMNTIFSLANPKYHGITCSVVVEPKKDWLLVGTTKGIICLWNTKTSQLKKSWRINSNDTSSCGPIKRLILVPGTPAKEEAKVILLGGSAGLKLTIWQVPSMECVEVLSPHNSNPSIKHFTAEEIKGNSINEILEDLTLDSNPDGFSSNESCITLYKHGSTHYIVHVLPQGRLIFWNLRNLERSSAGESTFSRVLANHKLAYTHETLKEERPESANTDSSNDVGIIYSPKHMIVTVDRRGAITLMI